MQLQMMEVVTGPEGCHVQGSSGLECPEQGPVCRMFWQQALVPVSGG